MVPGGKHRGYGAVKCIIKPVAQRNPCFWIDELKEEGESIPHIEYESGMYGYGGQSDYSDFSNLKEYVLHGIGSGQTSRIFHGEPMPFECLSLGCQDRR